VLGEVVDGEMNLSEKGQVVTDAMVWLAEQYAHVLLDAWCVMPNHVHVIMVLVGNLEQGGSRTAPTKRTAVWDGDFYDWGI
jgi:putative transposase